MSNRKKLRSTARKLQHYAAREAEAVAQMLTVRDGMVAGGMDPEVADVTLAVFARRRAAGLPLDGPEAEAEQLAATQPIIERLYGHHTPPPEAA